MKTNDKSISRKKIFSIIRIITFFTLQTNLNGHPNLIGYVDSSVTLLDGGIHEVLLLMPFHKVNFKKKIQKNVHKFLNIYLHDLFNFF